MIYCDHNATSPLRAKAEKALRDGLALAGNPSSVHAAGRQSKMAMNKARDQISNLLNLKDAQLIFTSGGTEANNLILKHNGWTQIFITAAEHDSVRLPREDAVIIPVDQNGLVDEAEFNALLAKAEAPFLVSIQGANNETGVIQNVKALAAMVHAAGGIMHSDMSQMIGKLPVDFADLGLDAMTISAHKMGGPLGAGALVIKESMRLMPLMRGGGQEKFFRPGTENIPAILGFAAGLEEAITNLPQFATFKEWRDQIENELQKEFVGLVIAGKDTDRLPNTSYIICPNFPAEKQVMMMDLEGIALSAGSACSSGKVKKSHVLTAMGFDEDHAGSGLRFSLGWSSTAEDVQHFLTAYRKMMAQWQNAQAA